MSKEKAVAEVLKVLRDGSRCDRYLRRSEDGTYFTTPDHTFLDANGPFSPPSVSIPVAFDTTESEEEEWAEALLKELDDQLSD
jgi:hypothetical protein